MPILHALGWTDALALAFASEQRAGLIPGRVALEHNHVYRVLTEEREWLAEAAGRVKYLAADRTELPAVGDWVALWPDPAGGRAVIEAVLPRKSWFSRKVAGRETKEQVVAANIDTVFLVFGLDTPMNARRLERYLVPARRSGAEPVIVLNKADVSEDVAAVVAEATVVAQDVRTLVMSARDGRGSSSFAPSPARGGRSPCSGRRARASRRLSTRSSGATCSRRGRCGKKTPAAATRACIGRWSSSTRAA